MWFEKADDAETDAPAKATAAMTGFQRRRLEFLSIQALKAGQPTLIVPISQPAASLTDDLINEAVEKAKVFQQRALPARQSHFGKRRKRVKATTTTTNTEKPEEETEEPTTGRDGKN